MRYFFFLCILLSHIYTRASNNMIFNPSSDKAPKEDIKPPEVIQWTGVQASASPDGTVVVGLRLTTKNEFTLYVDQVTFSNPLGYQIADINAPPSSILLDPLTEKEVEVYSGGDFILTFKGFEPYHGGEFIVHIRYLGCTSRICLFPYTEIARVPSYFAAGTESMSPAVTPKDKEIKAPNAHEDAITGSENLEEQLAKIFRKNMGDMSIFLLLLLIFTGGLLTNLTPCVYPMIPITIRILAKRGHHAALLPSLAYSLGIMLTYSSLGIIAALSGSLFGKFMALSSVNLFFAAVMAILAISMLGYGNFSSVQNLGNKIGHKGKGIGNAFFMGTGAGLVAAPCTGPILAALLTYTSKQNSLAFSILLLGTYSFGFALPYVFLGAAAAKISRTQVSPSVQVAIKTLFAAIMFSLSCYYLQVPFYSTYKKIDSNTWLGMGAITLGLAILFVLLLARSQRTKSENKRLAIVALMLGISLFSLGQSYRLSTTPKITWLQNEHEAFAKAEKENAPILIDMWANWCEACKKMDDTTFADSAVISLLENKKWILLKLDLTKEDFEAEDIQNRYEIAGLPTLIFIPQVKNGQSSTQIQKISGYISAASLLQFIRTERIP